jgi:hypothetical protein
MVNARQCKRKTAGKMPALPLNAFRASELSANARRAPFPRRHPRTTLPRRIMPHVLRVPALKVGDPIAAIVLMESDNPAAWSRRSSSSVRHCVFTQF